MGLLRRHGAEEITWQQWLHSTEPTAIKAEAASALAHAATTRTAAVLLDQVDGAMESAIRDVLGALQQSNADVNRARSLLRDLLSRSDLGAHLTTPWRIVLAGAPNVGKSTLLNAILGYARSITHPTPGTTRDLLTARTAIDGWPVELVDTAGLRDAIGLEEQGVRRARQSLEDADLCLWLYDVTDPGALTSPPVDQRRCLVIANKVDRPRAVASVPAELPVSALTGEGIGELLPAVGDRLVPHVPPAASPVPFCPALLEFLSGAQICLSSQDVGRAVQLLAKWLRPADACVGGGDAVNYEQDPIKNIVAE
jgi:tRNA modification GTPase